MDIRKYLLLPVAFLVLNCFANIVTAKYVIRLRSDAQCPMPGYFRDETNCRRFYRCAEHPTGISGENFISRAEFDCPPGTIFDEAVSGCNHVMFVQNIPPGCDVNGAMAGVPSGGSGSSDTSSSSASADSPPESSVAPSESTTSSPMTTTSHPPIIQLGQPPQLPIMAPENVQIIPTIPGVGDEQKHPLPPKPPMLPSINFPQLPGSQGPMIPDIPSVPPVGQQHQSLFSSLLNSPIPNGDLRQQQSLVPSLPSFNLPSVSGSPQLPQLTIPSNFKFPGISTLPSGQMHHLNNQNNQQNLFPEQNLQNLASSSAITITAQNHGQNENKPAATAGWITPQQFPQHDVVQPVQQGDSSGGWVVPNNLPTFYSTFSGRSPIYLSRLSLPFPLH